MPPHGGGDQGGGVRAESGELEDPERGAARADHGDGLGGAEAGRDGVQAVGVGDGVLGVAAGSEAEVDDDAAAEPRGVGAGAEGVDGAG